MKKLLQATLLAVSLAGTALAAPLPPTDEATATAVRQKLSGTKWTGTVKQGQDSYELTLNFLQSGRAEMQAKDLAAGGDTQAVTALWGILKAEPGDTFFIVMSMIRADSDGVRLEHDEEPIVIEGEFTPDGKLKGAWTMEGPAVPIELTAIK